MHSELSTTKKEANKSFFLNRSDFKNYTKIAFFLFYLITAHRNRPNVSYIWSNVQTDQTHLTSCGQLVTQSSQSIKNINGPSES